MILLIKKYKKILSGLLLKKSTNYFLFTCLLSIALLPLTLYTISLFPLYPDEIAIRPYLSRLPYEFPYRVTGLGACFSNFYQSIPITFYVPSVINWLMHGLVESPTLLRLIGVAILICWVTLLVIYVNKKLKVENIFSRNSQLISFSFVISLLFVGVVPFFLVMNRNEQLFFPSIVTLIWIFLICQKEKIHRKLIVIFLLVISYLIACSLIFYGHGKGLFLLPFMFIVGWSLSKTFSRPKLALMGIIIYLLIITFEAFISWKNVYKCPEHSTFEFLLKSYSIDPTLLFYNPPKLFDDLYGSLKRSSEYLNYIVFQNEYQINYLPNQKNGTLITLFNLILKINITIIFLSAVILLLIFYLKDFVKKNYISLNFLLLILLIIVIISSLFNLTKNFYDAGYLYTLLAIIFIFLIVENRLLTFTSTSTKLALVYLSFVCFISQFILISSNLKPFLQGFSGPGITIGQYEGEDIHESISLASQACNIDPKIGKFIVTDDLTYGYFRKSQGPILLTYLYLVNSSTDVFENFFNEVHSSGIIARCGYIIPIEHKFKFKNINNICCLSRNEFLTLNKK